MRPPRFRIRTLMIAVAMAAFSLYGWALWKRAGEYRNGARQATAREQLARKEEALYQQLFLASKRVSLSGARLAATMARVEARSGDVSPGLPFSSSYWVGVALRDEHLAIEYRDKSREAAKEAEHYAALRVKYERAARYPWLPVPADPPPPE